MPFYGGREPHRTSQNSARDVEASGRATQGGSSMGSTNHIPGGSLRDEPTIEELIEAREQTDAGLRLAFPQLLDSTEHLPVEDASVTSVPAEIDDAAIGRMADKIGGIRTEAARELRHLDKHAPRRIYTEAQGTLAKCDDFLAAVADHFRGESS
jgi:hypothetical protein